MQGVWGCSCCHRGWSGEMQWGDIWAMTWRSEGIINTHSLSPVSKVEILFGFFHPLASSNQNVPFVTCSYWWMVWPVYFAKWIVHGSLTQFVSQRPVKEQCKLSKMIMTSPGALVLSYFLCVLRQPHPHPLFPVWQISWVTFLTFWNPTVMTEVID